ncbi:hypothetical protein FB567DRAFT_518813 [Paraphoma chrysanthemicola]|uniref:Uncharacterized protein n=1 Tax=Paraphoma chrysanthemicola TaxID=798071 RepID=A0A8K0W2Q8_9PLEO|nr:hypothetical protein FB567DRAFT_518813 [Paraphoma chrysanthemicola]
MATTKLPKIPLEVDGARMTLGYSVDSTPENLKKIWVTMSRISTSKSTGKTHRSACFYDDDTKATLAMVKWDTVPKEIRNKAKGKQITQNTFLKFTLPIWLEKCETDESDDNRIGVDPDLKKRKRPSTFSNVNLPRRKKRQDVLTPDAALKMSKEEGKKLRREFDELGEEVSTEKLVDIRSAFALTHPNKRRPSEKLLLDARRWAVVANAKPSDNVAFILFMTEKKEGEEDGGDGSEVDSSSNGDVDDMENDVMENEGMENDGVGYDGVENSGVGVGGKETDNETEDDSEPEAWKKLSWKERADLLRRFL